MNSSTIASEALTRALIGLAEQGKRPRCGDVGTAELWTSDVAEDRAQAASWCGGCAIASECLAAGVGSGASWSVWAGFDFADKAGRERARQAVQA